MNVIISKIIYKYKETIMKRFTSVVLALLMLFVAFTPLVSAYSDTPSAKYPNILIEGRSKYNPIISSEGKTLFPVEYDMDVVKAGVADCLPLLGQGLLTNNFDPWVERFYQTIAPFFEELINEEDGEITNGSYAQYQCGNDETIIPYGADYFFRYDWRISACDVADQLYNYIQLIKEKTGAEKVNLIGRCYGGNVLAAYLYEYGCDDIDTAVYLTSLSQGGYMSDNAFAGKFNFNGMDIENAVEYYELVDDPALAELLRATVSFINTFYGLEGSTKLLTKFVNKLYPVIAPQIMTATFAGLVGYWGMVSEGYEDAKALIFAGQEDKYAGFIEKIDHYHYDIQLHETEIIQSCIDKGMKFANIAKYGCVAYPCFETSKEDGDDTIELRKASLGATVALLGETLNAKYLSTADMKYISSDKIVDSSTCAFKDYTWFFKGIEHGTFPISIDNFWRHICAQEDQMTVFDNENYPQFLKMNPDNETFAPLTDTPVERTKIEIFFAKISRFFTALINQFKSLLIKEK